jgi:CRP-like cAMP-binding protein
MTQRPSRCLLCEARYSNPVCQMSPSHFAHFASLTATATYGSGQKLFSQGDPAHDVFLIRSGLVKLVHGHADGAEQILRTAGPGETLGIGASPDTGMVVTAVATAATQVCRMPQSRIESLLREDPEFSMAWVHLLTDEVNRSREAILNLGPQAAAHRLANYLLKNCRDQMRGKGPRVWGEDTGADSRDLSVRMTHADLASTLSIAQETTTRLLGALEEAHIVKLMRGRIQILDLDRLAALSGFPGSELETA